MVRLSGGSHVVRSLPLAASLGAVALLLVVDVVVGGLPGSGLEEPPVVPAIGVAVAVLAARRSLVAATGAAVAVSLAVTLVAGSSSFLAMGAERTLPGATEVGGLALLLGVCLRSLTVAGAGAAVGAVGAALVGVVSRSGDGFQPLVVVAVALVGAVAVGAGIYLRWIDHDRRRDVGEAREHERLAMARELHDVVAHHVTGMVVQAQAAQAVWDERPAAARAAVAQIEAAGSDALRSMRSLVGALRADEGAELAPAASVDELRRLADRSGDLGLPVRLQVDPEAADLPADVAASVHRIVQEALTNAQRHATGATGVDVRVVARADRLEVRIHDDGRRRGPVRRDSGYGIIGMAERADALGGSLRAGPGADQGWLVEADLPLVRR